MTMLSSESSHPALSHTDRLAANWADFLLLVGRIVLGWLFFISAWGKFNNLSGFLAYVTTLKMPVPGFWQLAVPPVEMLIGATLILGLATRYAALASFMFVFIATAVAHRYWEYPAAQQANQYNHFLKNLAIMGGSLFLFVTGGGRYSLDAWLTKRR
jgi:putative oxidoreductase